MNYKKTLHIFYILILGVFVVGVESFIPLGRVGHSSILIGTKLYFFGGVVSNTIVSNEVFYLDVSQTFSTALPPWTDLTKIPFRSSFAGISLIDINNNDPIVYLFDGIMQDQFSGNDSFISSVFTFNINKLEWKANNISGKIPERRYLTHTVSDNKGKLYTFGGYADSAIGLSTIQYFNDMVILDTASLIWSYGSTFNAPIKRYGHSATILTNGVIVYIGGRELTENANMVDINQINFYNTNIDTWSVVIAKSTNIIEPRHYHSAVLAPNDNIIIYGGVRFLNSIVEPDVAILNVQNITYEWIVPTILFSNVNNKPPPMPGHTANLIENYMIIAFGSAPPFSQINPNYNSKIYVMDIRNYTWVDSFDPNNTKTPTQTPNSEDNKMKIVVGVLSGALGIVFLSAIGFLGYKLHKKHKRRQNEFNIHWFS